MTSEVLNNVGVQKYESLTVYAPEVGKLKSGLVCVLFIPAGGNPGPVKFHVKPFWVGVWLVF